MSHSCPDGHASEAGDYCDVCGLPIAAGAPPATPPAPAPAPAPAPITITAEKPCPNCGFTARADDLFCEDCGYDFTTGAVPTPAPTPTPVLAAPADDPAASSPTWVAEVWVDPDWYATQESDEACPSAGAPAVRPLRDTSVLVGRHSVSRGIDPQIDVGADHGVSRRQTQLTTDGQRWWAEDLQSSNGTYIGPAGAPLPTVPIPAGARTEFAPGDRIYVGAWTRIVVRRATADES